MLFKQNKYIEAIFVAIGLLLLSLLAYISTEAELNSISETHNNNRILETRIAEREIYDLLNQNLNVTPKISNLLINKMIAYILVQQTDGALYARAEDNRVSVGAYKSVEEQALSTSHLKLINYEDAALSITEVVLPVLLDNNNKLLIRMGFFRNDELARINYVNFRNTAVFLTFILLVVFYWYIKKYRVSNLQFAMLGGVTLFIILFYLASRFTLHNWFKSEETRLFFKHGLTLSKLMTPHAIKVLETSSDADIKESIKIISSEYGLIYACVIRDEQIIFHTDHSSIGEKIKDNPNYDISLNIDSPALLPAKQNDVYEVLTPLLRGKYRLGTMILGFHKFGMYAPPAILQGKYFILFASFLTILFVFMYLISRRISKELSWFIKAMEKVTAGDFRQQIHIQRNDEFGEMAHAFNFMLMAIKERDMIGRGLQQYVSRSVIDRTLKALSTSNNRADKIFAVSCFIYFSGIEDTIDRIDSDKILIAVKDCYAAASRAAQQRENTSIQLLPSGILMIFNYSNQCDSLLKAINASKLLAKEYSRDNNLPFSPKISLHSARLLKGNVNPSVSSFLGEALGNYKAISLIQDTSEIIATRDFKLLLKDVLNFEELELLTAEQGRISVFALREFKSVAELKSAFDNASTWTKNTILRILKNGNDLSEPDALFDWFKDEDSETKYNIVDVLESFRGQKVCDFITTVLETESEPKVIAKAISVLGKIGSEEHITIISEKLRSSNMRVKATAVEALESIGGKKVYEFLNLLVDEQDNRVKANILIALGKYGDLKVFDLLTQMIRDINPNMRASAAFAFGRLGMAQGVEPLITALSDKDPMVRRQVIASLNALKADLDVDFQY